MVVVVVVAWKAVEGAAAVVGAASVHFVLEVVWIGLRWVFEVVASEEVVALRAAAASECQQELQMQIVSQRANLQWGF